MDQNYIVNFKNIKLIKSTCPFYNYIFFREILLLLYNNLMVDNPPNRSNSYKDKKEDFKKTIQEMKNTIFSQMNLLYKTGEKNGNLKDDTKTEFSKYIKYGLLSVNNKEELTHLLNNFFKLFLKLSDDDDVKNNFFFNLLDNKENLIILPTYLESEIDGLKSYFNTININEKFFSEYFDNKNINDGVIDSKFIKEFDHHLNNNNTIYSKYINLLDKYDKADNIFYLPCITLSEIDKNVYEDILKKNLKDLNNKIFENYQNYSSDYFKKTTIIVKNENHAMPDISIYKNIYMFFDNKDKLSTKFLKITKQTHNNNKSIKYMNELLIKYMIESYDETNTFNRKISLDDGIINQMNSLIDYSLIDKEYKKEELIRYYTTNIKNKEIINIKGEINKASFFYLFETLNFLIKNKKIEENVNNKNINTFTIILNLNKEVNSDNNLDFNIKYKNSSKGDKKKNFLNNYSMNFFNFKHEEINIYIEKSSGVFNPLYTSNSDLEKYCDIILNFYNIDVKNKTKKKVKKKEGIKKMSNYEIDIISFIILHAQKPYNYMKQKFKEAKFAIKDVIQKKYNFIYKNRKDDNYLTNNYNLYIKLDKKDNINVFDIYLKNIENNYYHKINKFSGYFSKKMIKSGYNHLLFSTANLRSDITNPFTKFYYYNNLIITRKALKSYIKYNNLTDDVNNLLLKIITNKSELDDFYTYHIVTDELKKFIINKNNYYLDQSKIINNIIDILFNNNQEIYFEKSKYFDKYISDYKEGNHGDIVKETKIIDKVSTINNSENPNYPLFIIKDKNSTNKYILKNFIDNKTQITNNNNSKLSNYYIEHFKKIYNIRSNKGDIYRTIEDSENDSVAIINLDIKNTKYNNNPTKCDEKKQNITNKLKKYFKNIKNNITLRKIKFIGSF